MDLLFIEEMFYSLNKTLLHYLQSSILHPVWSHACVRKQTVETFTFLGRSLCNKKGTFDPVVPPWRGVVSLHMPLPAVCDINQLYQAQNAAADLWSAINC